MPITNQHKIETLQRAADHAQQKAATAPTPAKALRWQAAYNTALHGIERCNTEEACNRLKRLVEAMWGHDLITEQTRVRVLQCGTKGAQNGKAN